MGLKIQKKTQSNVEIGSSMWREDLVKGWNNSQERELEIVEMMTLRKISQCPIGKVTRHIEVVWPLGIKRK